MTFDLEKAKKEHRVTEWYDHLRPAALEEIARLQKIAACFEDGDSMWIEYAKKYMFLSGSDPSSVLFDLLDRLQKAAKLAEETCK